ncbi:SRPBCC family protein [Novosphingobium sp. KN65.2]|uniref:SRPBCC family protein n=1 Tax=Novosphingobium sp. KN65.2 TaxID=1478134 RepID=UPI0005DD3F39|nr:SRPBCC family protein [Novosphingobium sp. KN65.2]CDO35260.1 hypothetical protein SPHV1_2210028 [Novosphingobium sp. KN65.2]
MSAHNAPARISPATLHLSCIDLAQAGRWFQDGLGLIPAGGTRLMGRGPLIHDISEQPGAEAVRWRMLAANSRFRIDLYQFATPLPRLAPAGAEVSDIGYNRITVHAPDFQATLDRLARLGSPPIGPVTGSKPDRRACVCNPDGLFVEIMESDLLPDAPREPGREGSVAIRAIAISTPDLDASIASFSALLGESPGNSQVHDDAHEPRCGVRSAQSRRATFRGEEMLIELVEYASPGGRPRPSDWRISDQGVFAIAFTANNILAYRAMLERAEAAGAKSREARLDHPDRGSTFVRDGQGFLLELAWQDRANDFGYRPRPANRLVSPERWTVRAVTTIAAPLDRVWRALNDHERMGRWIQADEFHVTKDGFPDSAGYGAERLLITYGRRVSQQVTRVYPGHVGYRAIAGTPFNYHNGTVDASSEDSETRLEWTIRFRTNPAPVGKAVHPQLQQGIEEMLDALKDMVEAE